MGRQQAAPGNVSTRRSSIGCVRIDTHQTAALGKISRWVIPGSRLLPTDRASNIKKRLPSNRGSATPSGSTSSVETCTAFEDEDDYANRQTPNANCPLPTAHCPLPTAHCPLPTANRQPPTANRQPPSPHVILAAEPL